MVEVFVAVSFHVDFEYFTNEGAGYAEEVVAKFKECLVLILFFITVATVKI